MASDQTGPPKVCVVQWDDAMMSGHGTVYTREEAEAETLMHGLVCGFLVAEHDDRVVLAIDYFPKEGTFRGVHVYPKSGIVSMILFDAVQATREQAAAEAAEEKDSDGEVVGRAGRVADDAGPWWCQPQFRSLEGRTRPLAGRGAAGPPDVPEEVGGGRP